MKRTIFVCFIIALSLMLKNATAQPHGEWVQFESEYVYVTSGLFDSDFPTDLVIEEQYSDTVYESYLDLHLFPLPQESDFDKRLEKWLLNNAAYYPRFLPTGNPTLDSARYNMAKEFWMTKHEGLMKELSGSNNPTEFSDDDFGLLMNSFPRMENSGDASLDRQLYDEAVQEWIRLYSYEKYLIIEPLVRESEELLKLNEGK